MEKVFGIGLNKTATKSIAEACDRLGLRTLHDSRRVSRALVENRLRGSRPLDSLEDFDAYFDLGFWVTEIPYPELLRQLDLAYPGSRFILHTRSEDGWIESLREHLNRKNIRTVVSRLLTGERARPTGSEWEAGERRRYAYFHRVALQYFRGRPADLLVFDAGQGHGWRELCTFLERPIPSDAPNAPQPFPHLGARGERRLYRRRYYRLLVALMRLEELLARR